MIERLCLFAEVVCHVKKRNHQLLICLFLAGCIYIKCRSEKREVVHGRSCGFTPAEASTDCLVLGYLGVRAQRAQVALQVSVGHQLHHHQGGLPFGHNTQQTHLRGEGKGLQHSHHEACCLFI